MENGKSSIRIEHRTLKAEMDDFHFTPNRTALLSTCGIPAALRRRRDDSWANEGDIPVHFPVLAYNTHVQCL